MKPTMVIDGGEALVVDRVAFGSGPFPFYRTRGKTAISERPRFSKPTNGGDKVDHDCSPMDAAKARCTDMLSSKSLSLRLTRVISVRCARAKGN
jgi:hypothetical protein